MGFPSPSWPRMSNTPNWFATYLRQTFENDSCRGTELLRSNCFFQMWFTTSAMRKGGGVTSSHPRPPTSAMRKGVYHFCNKEVVATSAMSKGGGVTSLHFAIIVFFQKWFPTSAMRKRWGVTSSHPRPPPPTFLFLCSKHFSNFIQVLLAITVQVYSFQGIIIFAY